MGKEKSVPAIETRGLQFAYEGGHAVFRSLDLCIPAASRTLLIGANGVGKSTLLSLVAGRHLLAPGQLRVFGRCPFTDLSLSGEIALVDGDFPIHLDLKVRELLDHSTPQVDPKREKELLEILEIDPRWRMHRVSDGQRRRVQLLIALRRPTKLLLLDEVTAHLDVVGRADFISWLRERSTADSMTVLYATHIFDGLLDPTRDPWPTHVCFLGFESEPYYAPVEGVAALRKESLYSVCERWIRKDRAP